MYYHVRINQKSIKHWGELKLDLTKEKLWKQFIIPYENGKSIIINGKSISSDDIDRIRIYSTEEHSSKLIPKIRAKNFKNGTFPSRHPETYSVPDEGNDITDDLILGKPGYKKESKKIFLDEKHKEKNKDIFIVHGHDNNLKNELELFLKEIGLNPIVLHKKPDEGLTIIEKFEKHSNVGFAFILLTPDDIGYEKKKFDEEQKSLTKEKLCAELKWELRARQNVIFEFGYFVGKLDRKRVCCLYKTGVTLPNDLSGVLYKKVISSLDEIKLSIIDELRAADYPIYS